MRRASKLSARPRKNGPMLDATNTAVMASRARTKMSSISVKPPPRERRWGAAHAETGEKLLCRDARIHHVVGRAGLAIRSHRNDIVAAGIDAAGKLVDVRMAPGIERDVALQVGPAPVGDVRRLHQELVEAILSARI